MTETTIVQPGSSPSIYTTGHPNHNSHDDRFRETRLDADYRSLIAQAERYGTITGDRIGAVGTAGQLASCHTDSLVQAGFGDTSDRICASTASLTGALGAGFTAAALAACKTSDEVAAVYASLQKQVSDAATATVVGFKDAQATAYQIEGRTALDAAKNVASLGLQATTNANALSVEATKNFYALDVAATKNASAAQLEAQKNAAAAAMQLAECCCELKSLITAEGVSTRGLANEIEARRVQNELIRLQTQVTVLTGGVIGGGLRAS